MAFVVCIIAGFFLCVSADAGQVPDILKKPEISSLHIYSDIKYRFATTRVISRIKNVDVASREAIFDVTLPNEAFITNLTLEIDGKVIVGEIKEKEVAKQQYEAAKQRGESAGYIGTTHRETNRFNLAVTVAPQSKVSFNLTYQELLKRKHGHYEQVIYIDPGQPVPDMDITVVILESREITMLRVPPLRNDVNDDIGDLSTITVISQPTPKTAEIKFVPSIEFQTAQSAGGMAGQFVVQYDVERNMDAGDVLLVNGYFVHFFAPEGFTPIPNDVLFILDISGSMTGTKLSQLKDAMNSIIGQLNEGDRINIMTFSGTTSFWKTEMVDITDEDIVEEAKEHVKGLKAGGWTNIELALTNGIDFLGKSVTAGEVRSPVLVFLTDGEATQGITDSKVILETVRRLNEGEIPIFSLAFGQYADYNLVKKVAVQNNGIGRKIYEASDAALQIAGFYNEISVTLLSNVTFQYLDAPVADVTQHTFTNYFNGSEIVICGRVDSYDVSEDETLNLKISSNSVQGTNLVLTGLNERILDLSSNFTDAGDFEMITEKVWAYLTIKQLLDKELGAQTDDEKTAYRRQALQLSLQYGFVTPLTSMVVTLPDESKMSSQKLQALEKKTEAVPHLPAVAQSRSSVFASQYVQPAYLQNKFMFNRAPYAFDAMALPSIGSRGPSAMASLPDILDTDDDDSGVISKFGDGSPPKQGTPLLKKRKIVNRGRHQKRKNKKNRRKNRKVLTYPLHIELSNIADPLCFNLYDQKLDTGPGMYVLYEDSDTDLRVEIKLAERLQGKWTKQGAVQEIHLRSGQKHRVITSGNDIEVGELGDSVPWTVTPHGSSKIIELPSFNINVSTDSDGFIVLRVKLSANLMALQGDGIISQIWSKNIEFLKELQKPRRKKNNKPGKVIAVFRINGKRTFAIQRVQDSDKCWNPRPSSEASFVDMKVAAV